MNKKVFVILFAIIFVLNSVGFAQVRKTVSNSKKAVATKKAVSQVVQLSSFLPASDAVINVQMSRFMNEGLPQMLATKPQHLQEINGKMDEIKKEYWD